MMNIPVCARFLVVDDDETFRERLAESLRRRGHHVATAAGSGDAVSALDSYTPDYAIVDLRLGQESGLDVVRDLQRNLPSIKVLLLTGYGSIATAVDAMRLGAIDYLSKPVDTDQILAALSGDKNGNKSIDGENTRVPSLDRVEWEHMQRVLRDSGGNISEAARRLGIERRTLQRKLNKFPPDS